jgi:hypothetical protein
MLYISPYACGFLVSGFFLAKHFPGEGSKLQHPEVFEAVEHLLGSPPGLHDVLVLEKIQVLGDTGLGGLNLLFQFMDRLFSLSQQVNNVQTGRMGQDPETPGRLIQPPLIVAIIHNSIIL